MKSTFQATHEVSVLTILTPLLLILRTNIGFLKIKTSCCTEELYRERVWHGGNQEVEAQGLLRMCAFSQRGSGGQKHPGSLTVGSQGIVTAIYLLGNSLEEVPEFLLSRSVLHLNQT